MRRAARIDGNHLEIVNALRKAGATVQSLAAVGHGVPDLLVGWRGMNLLFEVKCPDQPPSKRRLTADEKRWHDAWHGNIYVVNGVSDALSILEFY